MGKIKNPIIMLKNISKKYDEYGVIVKALNRISLKIYSGEFVSIIGPSGCGKSTLLHCMGLLDRPTTGNVYIEGKNTSEISGKEVAIFRGSKLGFVFQNYNLIPRLTALENVILPGLIMKKDPIELEKKARELLKEVGIIHRSNHKGIHLSGGEQQRVAIARSLINNPILILADEPTGALDSDSSEEIMDILVKVNKNRNVTLVFVSHDMHIAGYGKRTLILKDGIIIGDTRGKIKNLKKVLKRQPKKKRGGFSGN
jgi:putative ABC transport system ATP-binding protein